MTRKAEEGRQAPKDTRTDSKTGTRSTASRTTGERRQSPEKPGENPTKTPATRTSRRRTTQARTPAEEAREVELQNRRYYDAFQALDPAAMGRVWWQDEAASCIHPGWDIRHGWPAIRDSYEMIFAGTQAIRFALGDVRVRVLGGLAYVTCVENLLTDETGVGDYLGAVLATNIFEKRRGTWRMIHHHASPFAPDEIELPEGPLH